MADEPRDARVAAVICVLSLLALLMKDAHERAELPMFVAIALDEFLLG